jgi:hypothetical protein
MGENKGEDYLVLENSKLITKLYVWVCICVCVKLVLVNMAYQTADKGDCPGYEGYLRIY